MVSDGVTEPDMVIVIGAEVAVAVVRQLAVLVITTVITSPVANVLVV
jgi:hypothetical protein